MTELPIFGAILFASFGWSDTRSGLGPPLRDGRRRGLESGRLIRAGLMTSLSSLVVGVSFVAERSEMLPILIRG